MSNLTSQPTDADASPPQAESLRDRVRGLRLPDAAPGERSWTSLIPWILCGCLTLSTVYFAWLAMTAAPAVATDDQAAPSAGNGSNPTASSTAAGNIALESKGYLIPAHQIQVSPKVGGMITKLYIREEGQQFKQNDVLAEIERTEYQCDHDRAVASLGQARERLRELENGNRPEEIQSAKAELAEAEANREQLYLDWKRNINLKTGNALAQREYELAQGAYLAADRRAARLREMFHLMVAGPRKERIDAARADVKQWEAELAKAKWRLDNCLVRAPVTGTILSKKAEEGNMVNPSAFSNGLSASLCDMADLSLLEVELDVQERDISKVFRGQPCKVRAEAFPDRVYEGVVSRLMPIANRAKGAVPVRVTVTVPREEEGAYLKPEMGAIVSFMKAAK
jgi:multidrug resistance efflux pump